MTLSMDGGGGLRFGRAVAYNNEKNNRMLQLQPTNQTPTHTQSTLEEKIAMQFVLPEADWKLFDDEDDGGAFL